jgi:hypothetical protein
MSVKTYKNIVIVDRNTAHNMKNLLQDYGCWFGENKPFEYSSANDKIIACYDRLVVTGSTISEIQDDEMSPIITKPDLTCIAC